MWKKMATTLIHWSEEKKGNNSEEGIDPEDRDWLQRKELILKKGTDSKKVIDYEERNWFWSKELILKTGIESKERNWFWRKG